MSMKKCVLLLLTLSLLFSLLSIGVAAHEEEAATGVFGSNMSVGDFVSLCIAGVVLVIVIVLCIVKRKKLVEALRAYRSEMKKITWYSWKNVVRGTVFVLVCVLVIAVVVGLLDFVFFELQTLLAETK
ncbi:MAG: preprotein translocase subunit SecE [Clostridia bacterium]|nr:preprotein translocase subunit SecE [Clostridia bacterium]MBO7341246.1 preprotein translocase subunit SecE [Clostridia bacterium]